MKTKKLINDPKVIIEEMLEGIIAAHPNHVRQVDGSPRAVVAVSGPRQGKVGLVIGGGSGHEPTFVGFVGKGLADACPIGNVFASPPPDSIYECAKAANGGTGVLFMYGNYAGDVMNFDMAAEMAGREVARVLTDDDVAVETSTYSTGRRGVAGTMIVEKILGAAAETGMPLAALKTLGDRVNERTRSMGVALTSCVVPAAGTPTFTLAEDEMEMGVGIHGEPGRRRVKLATADAIADEMIAAIAGDLPGKGNALLLVNGFGGTPLMELYLMFNAARERLTKHGIAVRRSLVGSYVTSLEMAGCSLTVTLLDDEIAGHWDAPVHTAALRWGM